MTPLSIGDAFAWWARREPDAVAVRCGDRVVNRAELDRRADEVARTWVADGLRPGDDVVLDLAGDDAFVIACVAVWKAGAVPLPLSPGLPAAERRAVLDRVHPWRVVTGLPEPAAVPPPALTPGLAAGSWKTSLSGGSTGVPKLVRAEAPAVVDPQAAVTPFLPLRAVQLVAAPLAHAAPFAYAMRGLMTGHELVLRPRFDAADWLRSIVRHRVTWAVLGPPMMRTILEHPDRAAADVSTLESVLHLGSPCPVAVKRGWIDWLGPDRVVEVYAGTEAAGITMVTGREWLDRPGTVGRPIGGSRFRVVRADGTDCRPGEVGEVLMRRDGGTSPDGWHSQGDRGRLDEDGWLFLAGRLDDVLVATGVSAGVSAAEIETTLEEHPAVRSAVVVEVPDPVHGTRIHAVVQTADLDAVIAHAGARLTADRRPRSWRAVEEDLRGPTGKLRRRDWRP